MQTLQQFSRCGIVSSPCGDLGGEGLVLGRELRHLALEHVPVLEQLVLRLDQVVHLAVCE